jgi:hypothetical protein
MDLGAVKPVEVMTLIEDPATEHGDAIPMVHLPAIARG